LIRSSAGNTLRVRLFQHIELLRKKHPSAILPIIMGSNQATLGAVENLKSLGYLIPVIRFPTVPKNTSRIRITLSANHSSEVIGDLKREIERLLGQ
jgi:7-keto-8-aminopelargonate synthetase-like enzyme